MRRMFQLQEKTLNVHDRALDSIQKVETLIGLMEALSKNRQAEPLEAPLVASAVGLIREEMPKLRQALEDLRELVNSFEEKGGSPVFKEGSRPKTLP